MENWTKEELDRFDSLTETSLYKQEERKQIANEQIQKIIFVIGTGTFVLSINFIAFLKTEISLPWVLISAWLFLMLTIASNLLYHRQHVIVANLKIKIINDQRNDPEKRRKQWGLVVESDKEVNSFRTTARYYMNASYIFLLLAIVALFVFCVRNFLLQNYIRHIQDINSPDSQVRIERL
jgi:hypothetical protein